MLTLTRYKVCSFRSVRESGWIETDNVTALIGTNESGKTNLLLPLWKLNPAKDGEIDLLADLPRAEYNRMRTEGLGSVFVEAEFSIDEALRAALVTSTGLDGAGFDVVRVGRRFNGERVVSFPNARPPRSVLRSRLVGVLAQSEREIGAEKARKEEAPLKSSAVAALAAAVKLLGAKGEEVDCGTIEEVAAELGGVDLSEPLENSTLVPRWRSLLAAIAELRAEVSKAPPEENPEVAKAVIAAMPVFVYYSNYGNLDSEIYLPHVIQNMKRTDLGAKEAAKARTLRVLFEYVALKPEEILELGLRAANEAPGNAPTPAAIEAAAKRTKEREVLLRSADAKLTKDFREWWKQGDYRFRFAADGDHFRIWVTDDKRPEEIELESRSTGLQWFFSFFLVFLAERRDVHKGAILLLDEPGLALHPLSQEDLSLFFQNLSRTNPLLYTTHSPFMVDADHLERVRLVYVDDAGATAVTSDLRATQPRSSEARSGYAVHAALGLSVSTALLQGCTSVIVEGPSDQFYFTAMKTILVARGKLTPKRELLFVPAGGAKGVNAMATLVTAKDAAAPVVVLDDDKQGRQFAHSLTDGPLYKRCPERVLNVREFAGGLEHAEVEDLLPPAVVADAASRVVRGKEDDFKDVLAAGPIVPQIESYARANGASTLAQGWKVDLAREVKKRLLKDPSKIPDATIDAWVQLFAHFEEQPDDRAKT